MDIGVTSIKAILLVELLIIRLMEPMDKLNSKFTPSTGIQHKARMKSKPCKKDTMMRIQLKKMLKKKEIRHILCIQKLKRM